MKTIKTETHLLLVDETEFIKEGYWFYSENERGVVKALANILNGKDTGNFKIIAASPKIEGIDEFETLPPNIEDDVEKLAANYVNIQGTNYPISDDYVRMIISQIKGAYKAGHKQAKSETMFSLGDMKKCWDSAKSKDYKCTANGIDKLCYCRSDDQCNNRKYLQFDELIQSLTKKEYEFVPEMIKLFFTNANSSEYIIASEGLRDTLIEKPKVINNKIQGTWIIK